MKDRVQSKGPEKQIGSASEGEGGISRLPSKKVSEIQQSVDKSDRILQQRELVQSLNNTLQLEKKPVTSSADDIYHLLVKKIKDNKELGAIDVEVNEIDLVPQSKKKLSKAKNVVYEQSKAHDKTTSKRAHGPVVRGAGASRRMKAKKQGKTKQTNRSHLFPHRFFGSDKDENLVHLQKKVNGILMKTVENVVADKKNMMYMDITATQFDKNRPDTVTYKIYSKQGKSYEIILRNLESAMK